MQRSSGHQAGMSLVSVMVAVGLVAILSVIFSKYFQNNMKEIKKVNDKSSAEDLRQYIRTSMNCTQTLASAPSTCTASGTPITLKKSVASAPALVIIPSGSVQPTKIGNLSVRAYCYDSAKTINLTYSADGTTWNTLFDIPLTCP